jgi:hypothetical protein
MNEPLRADSATMGIETGKDGDPMPTFHEIVAKQGDGSEIPPRKCCGCFQGNHSVIGYNILGLGEYSTILRLQQ